MSANLLVDIGNTTNNLASIALGAVAGSGIAYAASGGIIGQSCNLNNADTFCNLEVTGCPIFASGQLRIQVQSSDTDVSGNYTDPTSGIQTFPTSFVSGGILVINSGGLLNGEVNAPAVSGASYLSGFNCFAAFQRPGTFVRANLVSGDFYAGTLFVGFISQFRTTGSGGGFSWSPQSGGTTISV